MKTEREKMIIAMQIKKNESLSKHNWLTFIAIIYGMVVFFKR